MSFDQILYIRRQGARNKNYATTAKIIPIIKFFYDSNIECNIVFNGTITAIGMICTKQVCINEPACYEIIFAQIHLKSLLHIFFINLQLFFRKYRIDDEFRDYG